MDSVKRVIKRIVRLIVLVAVIVAPILIIPQVYDPLGMRYQDDVYQLVSRFECADQACIRLRLPEGAFTFKSGWRVTTQADGSRLVPDNAPDCRITIALIGDSYTWGPNVNDGQTWADLLARHFPAACFYNLGEWGYNVEQAALTLKEVVSPDADYVIYFIFQNDDMGLFVHPIPGAPPSPFYAVRYMQLIAWRTGLWAGREGWIREADVERNPDTFAATIRDMAADPRVRFAGFESELLVQAVRDMGQAVFGIPLLSKDQQLSPIDAHPNAAGHQAIAQSFYPLVEELLAAPHPTSG